MVVDFNLFDSFCNENKEIINYLKEISEKRFFLKSFDIFKDKKLLPDEPNSFSILSRSPEQSQFEKEMFNKIKKDLSVHAIWVEQKVFNNYTISYRFKLPDRYATLVFDFYNANQLPIDYGLQSVSFSNLDFSLGIQFCKDKITILHPTYLMIPFNTEPNVTVYKDGSIKNIYNIKNKFSKYKELNPDKEIVSKSILKFFIDLELMSKNGLSKQSVELLMKSLFYNEKAVSKQFEEEKEFFSLLCDFNVDLNIELLTFDLNKKLNYEDYKPKTLKDTNYFKQVVNRIGNRN